jgi:tRNA-2-methylthio-N6-dimethylallyladenosine synthase
MIGKVVPVLLERQGRQDGQTIGRSPYMQSVIVTDHEHFLGEMVDVLIEEAHPNSVTGCILTGEAQTAAV